jgi:hypothetical protein
MEDTLFYPRELIAERVVFTPADHAQIALCRGAHNRLGFAYQMAFLRLTGRFPHQQPLELLPDVLAFVASELALAPTVIEAYAQRQATVSAHQEGVTGRPLSSAIRAPPFEILRDRARRCGKIGSPMSKWGKKHGYPPCIRGAT